MSKLVSPYLDDILEAVGAIEEALAGKTFEEYAGDWILRRAVERGIEIVSEASRRIPEDLQARQPHIAWRRIAEIGNILRHDYRRIADRILYDAARKELPALKIAVAAIAAELDEPRE